MNLYSFLGSLTLLLFFANANANNCGAVYGADQYNDLANACNCTNGEIVACDDLSNLTPSNNNDDITLYFFSADLKNFDGSFLANSSVTNLALYNNQLKTENITNFPLSVRELDLQNNGLTNFDGSFLANSSVTVLDLSYNNQLETENITNFPSSVRALGLFINGTEISDMSVFGNSITHLELQMTHNPTSENIINFPSSVTWLGLFIYETEISDMSVFGNTITHLLLVLSQTPTSENIINFPSSVRELGLYVYKLNSFDASFLANSNVQNVYLSGNESNILSPNITNMPSHINIKYGELPEPEITPPTTQTPTPPTTQTPPTTPTPTSSEKLSTALIIVIAISSFIFVTGGLYALYLKCNGNSGGNHVLWTQP